MFEGVKQLFIMNLLSYNIRGVGSSSKRKRIGYLVQSNKLMFVLFKRKNYLLLVRT